MRTIAPATVLAVAAAAAMVAVPPATTSADVVSVSSHSWYANEFIAGASRNIWSDSAGPIPTDRTYCFSYGLGTKLMNLAGSAGTAKLTGFETPAPYSDYQRSTSDDWPGANTCQIAGQEMGFQLHKDSIVMDNAASAPGDLYGMQMLRNWGADSPIAPWADEFGRDARLLVEANYEVGSREINATTQYGQLVLSIVDRSQDDARYSDSFWLTISLEDSRGGIAEGVHLDTGGTNNFVVTTYAATGLRFVTPHPASQDIEGTACACSWYGMYVSRTNLIKATKALNGTIGETIYSSDPANYRVNLVAIGTEMHSPDGTTGWVGSRTWGLRLQTQYLRAAELPIPLRSHPKATANPPRRSARHRR
jgi:hypothetical protein